MRSEKATLVKPTKADFFKAFEFISEDKGYSVILKFFTEIWERFSSCPASTRFHDPGPADWKGAYPGGLLDHTYNVVKTCINLSDLFKMDDGFKGSLIKCAYLHDIGKMGNDTTECYLVNKKDDADKKPYYWNDISPCDHELRSIWWCQKKGIILSEEEIIAILHHAGPYRLDHGYINPDSEHPLTIMLFSADNLVAKILGI